MLYSSGTTGRPKGVRKPLPDTPFGDPASAPVQIAQGIAASGIGPGSVYLSPAPLYHAAPLVYSMSVHRTGGTVVVMERFDPELCLELIERHRVTHAQFVPTMFVRHAAPAGGRSRPLRRLEPPGRHARRRAVPGRDQAPDDRLVGPDHPRVLLGHRGHRRHVHHRRGVAGAPRIGRTPGRGVPHRRPRRRRATARASRAPSTSPAAARSSTTTTPTRPTPSPTIEAGGRWATSGTSTTTATSTSPTAKRT